MKLNRNQIALGALAIAVLGGGAFYLLVPKKRSLGKPDLPPNTIYYTGPLKGKQGDYASDAFFPELGSPTQTKSNSGNKQ